jgi:hypothetical protein
MCFGSRNFQSGQLSLFSRELAVALLPPVESMDGGKSGSGHTETSRRVRARSALPQTTDMGRLQRHVGSVPEAEVMDIHSPGQRGFTS